MNIDLKYKSRLRLRDGAGIAITARAGHVWITEQDSRRDVILRPGESFTLMRPGLAIVEALDHASISLEAGRLEWNAA
jgi:Protein of unknown function (DUF2917)